MRHPQPFQLTVHRLGVRVIRVHRFGQLSMVHRLAVSPHRRRYGRTDRPRQRSRKVGEARRRRQSFRWQTRQRNGGQRHKEAGHREALDKLWPGRRAKIHTRFKGIGTPVEADGIHNKAEGYQSAHIQFMRKAADNRRQDHRNNPYRRRGQPCPRRRVTVDLLQQLRQQNNRAEVEHIREADTQAADGEVARLKQRQIDYRVIVGQLPDNQEADSHHRHHGEDDNFL